MDIGSNTPSAINKTIQNIRTGHCEEGTLTLRVTVQFLIIVERLKQVAEYLNVCMLYLNRNTAPIAKIHTIIRKGNRNTITLQKLPQNSKNTYTRNNVPIMKRIWQHSTQR
jgi:hypothetical protein